MGAAPSGNTLKDSCKKVDKLPFLTSERRALRGCVTRAVGSEAGVTRRVGELDHCEQRQHPGPGGERGYEGGIVVKQLTEET